MKNCCARLRKHIVCGAILVIAAVACAAAQQTSLELDPAQTSVKFTLGDVLHTVHGTFQLKRGALEFDPSSGKISGTAQAYLLYLSPRSRQRAQVLLERDIAAA